MTPCRLRRRHTGGEVLAAGRRTAPTTACTPRVWSCSSSPSAWVTWSSRRTMTSRLSLSSCYWPTWFSRTSSCSTCSLPSWVRRSTGSHRRARTSGSCRWALGGVRAARGGRLLWLLPHTAGCTGPCALWGGCRKPSQATGSGNSLSLRWLPLAPPTGGSCPGSPVGVCRLCVYCGLGSPWGEEMEGSAPRGCLSQRNSI